MICPQCGESKVIWMAVGICFDCVKLAWDEYKPPPPPVITLHPDDYARLIAIYDK